MNVTVALVSVVVLLGLALAWRFYRWRWRPRLIVDAAPHLARVEGAAGTPPGSDPDWLLGVQNAGEATAKNCRATLLRLDLEERGRWRRIEPDQNAVPMCWSDGATERDLAAGEAADMLVARGNGLPPGRYRLAIAVIDGEERRAAFDLTIADPDAAAGEQGEHERERG